jgi:hypothetical protein
LDGDWAHGPRVGPATRCCNPRVLSTFPATSDYGRRKQARPPRVLLPADHSAALREKLTSEVKGFTDSDALTIWAHRILALKNQFTTSDAQAVEAAFASKLSEFSDDGVAALNTPESGATMGGGGRNETATPNGSAGPNSVSIPKEKRRLVRIAQRP